MRILANSFFLLKKPPRPTGRRGRRPLRAPLHSGELKAAGLLPATQARGRNDGLSDFAGAYFLQGIGVDTIKRVFFYALITITIDINRYIICFVS